MDRQHRVLRNRCYYSEGKRSKGSEGRLLVQIAHALIGVQVDDHRCAADKGLTQMWRSTFLAMVAAMMPGAVSAQSTFTPEPFPPDPQKIDSMTRNCVYHSAFYSQGAVICIGGGRGLQCSSGSWVPTQDPSGCMGQMPTSPSR